MPLNGEEVKKKGAAIPTIEFRPHDETTEGVELFELDSLYKKTFKSKHDPFAPHRVNFHHLIYITEGVGTHFIDFNRYPCQAGSFIFINSRQVHAFDLENQPQGLLLIFTQAFLDSIRTNIRVPVFSSGFYAATGAPVLTVQGSVKESFEVLLAEIQNVSGENPHDRLIFQLLFTALVLKLHQLQSDVNQHQVSEQQRHQFEQFLSLIEDKYTSVKDASYYADLMGMSYKSLNQVCKSVTRQTPKQIIDAHTILEAKRKLAIERIQITQLAYELGFEDVSNFVKYFKKHTLVTPSQFQANLTG